VDIDLVEAAQRGDQGAFMDLVNSRGDRLYSIAQRILRDPDRFDAWVHRLLTNVCIAQPGTTMTPEIA
jgi:DNA-directed RNA polymerase specialized sigma24 family protein